MGGMSRVKLAEALRRIRTAHCDYGGSTCDCKFGLNDVSVYGPVRGEQTGCPELGVAAAIIVNMTDEEFLVISKRTEARLVQLQEIFGQKEENDG